MTCGVKRRSCHRAGRGCEAATGRGRAGAGAGAGRANANWMESEPKSKMELSVSAAPLESIRSTASPSCWSRMALLEFTCEEREGLQGITRLTF